MYAAIQIPAVTDQEFGFSVCPWLGKTVIIYTQYLCYRLD